jgi:uncharacterized protein (TIGR02598 family)
MSETGPRLRLLKRAGGFSLVEVVMALGVITFAMMGVLGLLALSANYSAQSSRETTFALMTQSTISYLRNLGFANIPAFNNAVPYFYYDVDGRMALQSGKTADTSAAAQSASTYSCTVTRYTPDAPQNTNNLIILRLEFSWPVNAPAANQQTTDVYTGISND